MSGDILNLWKLLTALKLLIVCWWFFYGLCIASIKDIRNDTKNLVRNRTEKEKLRNNLLLHYDIYTLPDYRNTNEIDIIMLFNFAELTWIDRRLSWNAKDYNDIEYMQFGNEEIWKPDLTLYNAADDNVLDDFGKTNVVCYYNGTLTWVAPTLFQAFCPVDVLNWPFDKQTCELKFGSWTYDGTKIDLKIRNTNSPTERLYFSEWIITKVTSKKNLMRYQCCPENYVDVSYNITIQRKHSSFKTFIILPTFALATLTLSLFWTPPQSSLKFILAGANIIVASLLLSFYGEKVPVMLHKVPLIVRFYDNVLCLTMLYLIFSIITYAIADPNFRSCNPVPGVMASFLNSFIVDYMTFPSEKSLKQASLQSNASEENALDPIIDSGEYDCSKDKTNGVEWFFLFLIINRALFFIYAIIFAIIIFRIVLVIEN